MRDGIIPYIRWAWYIATWRLYKGEELLLPRFEEVLWYLRLGWYGGSIVHIRGSKMADTGRRRHGRGAQEHSASGKHASLLAV